MSLLVTFLTILSVMWLVYYAFAMWKLQTMLMAARRKQYWDFRGIAITAVAVAFLIALAIV